MVVHQEEPKNASTPPENEHMQLLKWAKEQGITTNGVGPAKIPGKGLGVVAERGIKVRVIHATIFAFSISLSTRRKKGGLLNDTARGNSHFRACKYAVNGQSEPRDAGAGLAS